MRVQLTLYVDEEEIRDCKAENREATVILRVLTLNGKEAFTIKNEDFFRLIYISPEEHRVETLRATASADLELRTHQLV